MADVANVLENMCISIYEKFSLPTNDGITNIMVIGDHSIGGVGPAIDLSSDVYNNFFTSVNGQLFEDDAPFFATYPYAVYSIPSARSSYGFQEEYTYATFKLTIYSANMDSTEIKQIYRYASDLFDDCLMLIIGSYQIWMKEDNLTTMLDNHITPDGTKKVLVYTIDFEVLTQLKRD